MGRVDPMKRELETRGIASLRLTDDTAITIVRVREIADDNAAGSAKARDYRLLINPSASEIFRDREYVGN